MLVSVKAAHKGDTERPVVSLLQFACSMILIRYDKKISVKCMCNGVMEQHNYSSLTQR